MESLVEPWLLADLRWGYNSLSAALLKDLAEEEPINTRPGGGLKDVVELFTTKMGKDVTRFLPIGV